MHPPQKDVSQEDMWKVLEKHGGTRPKEGQTPKAELRKTLPRLEWDKPVKTGENSGYLLSLCGLFSISKDSVKGVAMYTAWRRRQGETPERMLGIRDHLAEAKHLCERDR
jgi:hypothetical protein